MDRNNTTIYDLLKEYSKEVKHMYEDNNESENPEFKEFQAIEDGNLLEFDMELFNNLNTDTSRIYMKYINSFLDTQEHSGNAVFDISIDRETASQLAERVEDLLKADFDYVNEILLNSSDTINGGDRIYDIFNSLLSTLLLTELFMNRRPCYDINTANI